MSTTKVQEAPNQPAVHQPAFQKQPSTEKQVDDYNKEPSLRLKATFLAVGYCQYISWNAVLATFYYFAISFDFTVFHKFTIITQVGQMIAGAAIYPLSKYTTILTTIGATLSIVAVLLLILPVLALTMPNAVGLNLALVIIFINGCINAVAENAMNAVGGQEGGKLNQLLWSGGGLCGFSMIVLNIILNIAFSQLEDSVTISAFIFFILSSGFIFVAVYLLKTYAHSKGITTYMKPKKADDAAIKMPVQAKQEIKSGNSDVDSSNALQTDNESQAQLKQEEEPKKEKSLYEMFIISFKYAKFLPICIFLTFFSTFAVFPKLTLIQVQFTSEFLNKDKQMWGVLLLNFVYNFSDVIGKYIGGFKAMKNVNFQYFVAIARLTFFATSLCIAYRQGDMFASEWFPFVNMFMLSFTSGLNTSSVMELAPRSAKDNKEAAEIISYICSNLLVFGIFVGSIVAVPLDPNYEIKYFYDD